MSFSQNNSPVWHLLQVSDVLDLEMATALAELVPVLAWEPNRSAKALYLRAGQELESPSTGGLRRRDLPLLPGRTRFPITLIERLTPSIVDRLLLQTPNPEESPLICTVPYFARVAEQWPGPVVYWLTDFISAYSGANRKQVLSLDRRMTKAATLVCPNSTRLAAYLTHQAGCDQSKIMVLPNATRKDNLLPFAPGARALAHPELASVGRPIAGVIGNLSVNMDWILIQGMMELAPEFSWVFIGSTTMPVPNKAQRAARSAVMQHRAAHFLGRKPYGELAGFARTFDVAILPYLRCEPTYSGSSTRFYEHLAACRPMLATAGLEELKHKTPLLKLFASAADGAAALHTLMAQNFDDGYLEQRWYRSLENTWTARALQMQAGLRFSASLPLASSF